MSRPKNPLLEVESSTEFMDLLRQRRGEPAPKRFHKRHNPLKRASKCEVYDFSGLNYVPEKEEQQCASS